MRYTSYQFAEHVDKEIENLPADVVRSKNTREGKKLIEEMRPLSRLALLLKCPGLDVYVEITPEGSEADGIIYETGFRQREFKVQITHGFDYEESLRMELLNKQGYAPASGPIYRDKKTKVISSELVGTNADEYFTRVSSKVLRLYDLKARKKYSNEMVLIIGVSEYRLSGLTAWVRLYEAIKNRMDKIESKFISVYLFNEASNEILRIC